MAGLGFRTFSAGEVLTAANVNNYLMQQAVMVFDDDSARSSSLGTAVSEGMLSYLKDSDVVQVYNGTAWAAVDTEITSIAGSAITGEITTATISGQNVTNTLTASTATSYTLQETDQGSTLQFTAAGTTVITVSTATAFTAGQRADIVSDSTLARVEAGAGVTFGGAGTAGTAYTFDKFDAVSILCVSSNAYRIIGNITAV